MTDSAMTEPDQPSPSLLRHLAAMVYDTLLILALLLVVLALALGARVALVHDGRDTLEPVFVWLLTALCFAGFYGVFWLKGGQTLGMQAWRIKLVASDGGDVNARQALLRCAAAPLSVACFGLGYLWMLVDRNGRYWHDYLSGTHLVLLPKKSRKSA